MRKTSTIALIGAIILALLLIVLTSLKVWNISLISFLSQSTNELISPWVENPLERTHPLNKYSFTNLKNQQYQTDKITLTRLVEDNDDYSSFLFSYKTMNKTMTGLANVPKICQSISCPVILLVRGYADKEQYSPGFGTKNAAKVFADNQYITLAPDFFGFAGADPEPEDTWEARFIKPINIIELIKTIQTNPTIYSEVIENTESEAAENHHETQVTNKYAQIDPNKIGIWAHSNGGQITLSVLQILSEPIPATLWAPVTAPFPYSLLFFTRTNEDEGKEARAWIAIFEKDYDVFEFSITKHIDSLTGPLQIHHGSRDKDALQEWSDSFIQIIEVENNKRAETDNNHQPIEYQYYIYPDADHNLLPSHNWQQAIQRDLLFFKEKGISHE